MRAGKAVAIAVPVFRDRLAPGLENWNTIDSVEDGLIIDPPPTSVAVSGHAVCVVGFTPDLSEVLGGYFIFRNSWGTAQFARSAPSGRPGRYVSRPGYGQISASYVQSYLWELCYL